MFQHELFWKVKFKFSNLTFGVVTMRGMLVETDHAWPGLSGNIEYIEALGGMRKTTGAGISEVHSMVQGPGSSKDDFEPW